MSSDPKLYLRRMAIFNEEKIVVKDSKLYHVKKTVHSVNGLQLIRFTKQRINPHPLANLFNVTDYLDTVYEYAIVFEKQWLFTTGSCFKYFRGCQFQPLIDETNSLTFSLISDSKQINLETIRKALIDAVKSKSSNLDPDYLDFLGKLDFNLKLNPINNLRCEDLRLDPFKKAENKAHGKASEGAYNERMAEKFGYKLLDKQLIENIEVCDLVIDSTSIAHVKRGHEASSMSHLLWQVYVSIKLLLGKKKRGLGLH